MESKNKQFDLDIDQPVLCSNRSFVKNTRANNDGFNIFVDLQFTFVSLT